MMFQDLIPDFYNKIGLCFGVGPRSHNIIKITSIDEAGDGIFIQKSFHPHVVSVTLLVWIMRNMVLCF